MRVAGTFIRGGAGRIFVVSHEPERPTDRAVLVVPAFAEEMNKSRRLAWETGRALCEHGFRTFIPDLYGTGDSQGEFADAHWRFWIDDLCRTVEWARGRGAERFSLLLVRLGGALFADAEGKMDAVFERAVAWQPIFSGAEALHQLLRMKAMASRMLGGRVESPDVLLRSLLAGSGSMELGGYVVRAELAKSIQQAVFPKQTSVRKDRFLVIEFRPSTGESGSTSRPESADERWQHQAIAAERFWLAVDPRPSPVLVNATVDFLSDSRGDE